MDFSASLEYLLNLGNEVLAMKLGLENIEKLLVALDNPQRKFLKIQVAGTNGKGSTCAFLDSICVSADIKTGLFTSPHLVSITERIKINGQEISEEDFARHATKVREISERLLKAGKLENLPTFFEQITAIAISAFGEAKIQVAILETGLGGRFDATTATRAEIVALTPIDFDHQDILGNSLKEIAGEKAAIIREDTKVITAQQRQEAKSVIVGKCREKQIEPIWATTDIKVKKLSMEYGNASIAASFITQIDSYPDVILGLRGRHQLTNAALAIAIAEKLRVFGFQISNQNIRAGLENTKYKGRLEFWSNILFDGAHNIAGARALSNFLDEFIEQPITMIFGAMRDKDLSEISQILFPRATFLIFTKPDNPRAMETAELVKFLPVDFDKKNVYQCETVKEAIVLADYCSIHGITCVTGSLYLVGEAQYLLTH
jgi:dihydrofolate synthase/folylpolyglutamate synthase